MKMIRLGISVGISEPLAYLSSTKFCTWKFNRNTICTNSLQHVSSSWCEDGPRRLLSSSFKLNSAVLENDSKILFTKLSQKQNYRYLDPDIHNAPDAGMDKSDSLPLKLVQALKYREDNGLSNDCKNLEEELKTFKEWARNAQLRVGFLLHLNGNINSKDYLTKVIQIICAEDVETLQSHELITLLLLIYFRRDISLEEISELLDLELLQSKFGSLILNGKLSPEEIVAGCIGLKSIQEFKATSSMLRESLYRSFEVNIQDKEFLDFYMMTVLNILYLGNQLYKDPDASLEKAFKTFRLYVNDVSIATAIKFMCFGITKGQEDHILSEAACKRLENNLHLLGHKDISSLSRFYSKSMHVSDLMVRSIKGEMLRLFDESQSIEDIIFVLKSLSYLATNEIYRIEVSKPLLDAFSDVLPSEVNLSNLTAIAERVMRRVTENHKNRDAILADMEALRSDTVFASIVCRTVAQLCFNMRLDEVEIDHMMSMDTAAAIHGLFSKKLPLQLYSPQMSLAGLDSRSRLLVNCYRGICDILGSERYCGVAKILPHFPDPDIVFGSLAGTPMLVPDYLVDPNILRPKRAPPGDWNVLIMATKKSLNTENKIMGIDEIKVRQLKWLGFNPVIIPYGELKTSDSAKRALYNIFNAESVTLPNLDDGHMEKHKKY